MGRVHLQLPLPITPQEPPKMVSHPNCPDARPGQGLWAMVFMWLVSCLESEVRGQTRATRTSHLSVPGSEAYEEAKSCGESSILSQFQVAPSRSPESCPAVATHAQVNCLGCPYPVCLCGTGQCHLTSEVAVLSHEHLRSCHREPSKPGRQSPTATGELVRTGIKPVL